MELLKNISPYIFIIFFLIGFIIWTTIFGVDTGQSVRFLQLVL